MGINNPDASVGVCCSHKVVAVGFNTLHYDASVGVLNPPHESIFTAAIYVVGEGITRFRLKLISAAVEKSTLTAQRIAL